MNKTSFIAGIFALTSLLSMATPVQATVLNRVENRIDNRQEKRENFKENVLEKVASRPGLLRMFKKIRGAFAAGKITAINGTTLTVEKDGKSITVLTGVFDKCTTVFRRRFWGTSSLAEYTVGDSINVTGKWQDEAKTTIEACVIRDVSIQKMYVTFVGEVLSLTSNGWVMKTVGRGNQTVTVTASTKFVDRREQAITQADVKVGHRVRIKRGLWNRVNNTVTEVTNVKDFSLPVRPSGTVAPTPTPVATVTPTATPTP